MEGQDPFEDQDVGSVHGHGLGLPAMGHKVVDGNLDLKISVKTRPVRTHFNISYGYNKQDGFETVFKIVVRTGLETGFLF